MIITSTWLWYPGSFCVFGWCWMGIKMIENAEGNPNISGFQLGFQNWSPWWASPHRISLVNSRFVTSPVSKFGWESVETLCSISWPQADNRSEDTVLYCKGLFDLKTTWRFCNKLFLDLKSMLAHATKMVSPVAQLLVTCCLLQPPEMNTSDVVGWGLDEDMILHREIGGFSAGQKSKLTLGAAFWTFLGTKTTAIFREVGVWYAWNAWLGLGGMCGLEKSATVFPLYHGGKGTWIP